MISLPNFTIPLVSECTMAETYLYVIAQRNEDGFTQPIKIGISNKPQKRLRQIQTSCPFRIGIVTTLVFPNEEVAATIERCLHQTQTKHRSFGEWFDIDPDTASLLVCMACRAVLNANIKDPELINLSLQRIGVINLESELGE